MIIDIIIYMYVYTHRLLRLLQPTNPLIDSDIIQPGHFEPFGRPGSVPCTMEESLWPAPCALANAGASACCWRLASP